jgi:hypothetical protein
MNAFASQLSGGPATSDSCQSVADVDQGGQDVFKVNGVVRGKVWCYRNKQNEAVLLWTDTKLNIAGVASETHDSDFQAFLDWWQSDSGPV